MADQEVDLFVIGAGSGGVRAARIAAGYGAQGDDRRGIPRRRHLRDPRLRAEEAPGLCLALCRRVRGRRRLRLDGAEPTFDWATLIANKDREIARLEAAYTANARARQGRDRQEPRGARRSAHRAAARRPARRVRAKHILIATGGAPSLGAEIAGLEHVISSNEAFHLDELPKRILIQGGGYIAVEFAGIFDGLGSEVTLVYRGDNILRGFDDDVREHLRAEMEKRGIKIVTRQIVEARREGRSRPLRRAVRTTRTSWSTR